MDRSRLSVTRRIVCSHRSMIRLDANHVQLYPVHSVIQVSSIRKDEVLTDLGAGAAFALEDVYVLTRAVKWAHERGLPIQEGLELFDRVRAPHYAAMVRTVVQMFISASTNDIAV